MIKRLHYWLDLSATSVSPITSPSTSATRLSTIGSGCGQEVSDGTKDAQTTECSTTLSDATAASGAAGSDESYKASKTAATAACHEMDASAPVSPPGASSATTTAVFWKPEFPLLPGSRGFCLSMQKTLPQFSKFLESHGITQSGTL